jgi:hypothetical protein
MFAARSTGKALSTGFSKKSVQAGFTGDPQAPAPKTRDRSMIPFAVRVLPIISAEGDAPPIVCGRLVNEN